MWYKNVVSFFCLWLSIFPPNIYWRDNPFSIDYLWLPYQILVDRICVGLFLGFWFCSIDVFVSWYQYHTVMITMCVSLFSCSVVSDSLQLYEMLPARLLSPRNFSGKNIEVGFHFLHQGIFPTQGSNLCLCLVWNQEMWWLVHFEDFLVIWGLLWFHINFKCSFLLL